MKSNLLYVDKRIINKEIVFLIGFVICLGMLNSITLADFLYVENITEASTTGAWGNPTNIYDSNYNTYATHPDTDTNYYGNYTIPDGYTINNSLWQSKDGYGFRNITLTTTCSEHDNKLVLRSLVQEGGGSSFHRYYCLNNVSAWVQIGGYGDASNEWFYEEAMFFNEIPPPPILNFTECIGNLIIYEIGNQTNFSSDLGGYQNKFNINDTNYSTYGTYRGCETDYYYVNYTLPDNILNINSSLWQYKDETIFTNFSIDNTTIGCFNDSFDKIQFYIETVQSGPTTNLKCYNGTQFITFHSQVQVDMDIYEEGLWLCLVPPALTGTYKTYSCINNNSVKNTTVFNGTDITETLEIEVCANGCNENNPIVYYFDNEPSLCNPKRFYQDLILLIVFVVVILISMAILERRRRK